MAGHLEERTITRTSRGVLWVTWLLLALLAAAAMRWGWPWERPGADGRRVLALVGGLAGVGLCVTVGLGLLRRSVRIAMTRLSESEARAERAQAASGRLGALRDGGVIRRQLMEISKEMTGSRRSAVWLRDGNELRVVQALGLPIEHPANVIKMGEGLVGLSADRGITFRNEPLSSRDRQRDEALNLRTHTSLIVPIRLHSEVVGVLDLRNKRHRGTFDESDQGFVEALSRQAGVSLEGARFREDHGDFEEAMLILLQEFIDRHLTWPGHTGKVVRQATSLARAMGLPPADRRKLRLAAMLHDLGLKQVHDPRSGPVGGPPEHAELGAVLLMQNPFWASAAPLVRWSEERADGSGPLGLAGHDVPMVGRILAFAEWVDNVTNLGSPWGEFTETELRARLAAHGDPRFDSAVIKAFLSGEADLKISISTMPMSKLGEADIREELDLD